MDVRSFTRVVMLGGVCSFFFNVTATTEIYTLSLHDALPIFSSIERLEKPVVAAIGGLATGAGTQLALSCDLRIASENARFLFREGMIGFIPSHGGCVRLVKLIGLARARDILLGGEDLEASEAFRHGLVTRVVPHDKLLDEARERLRQDRKSTRLNSSHANISYA